MSPALLAITLVVFVDLMAFMLVLPLLPFYATDLGASAAEVGLLTTAFAACQLIAGPILGALSDRFGRRPVLLVSQLGTLLGFVLMILAADLRLLFLARALDGFTAGNIGVAYAYVSDATPRAERAAAFGKLGVGLGLSLILGPGLSGVLAGYDVLYPLYAACLFSAASIAATAAFVRPVRSPDALAEARATPLRLADLLPLDLARQPLPRHLLLLFGIFALGFAWFVTGLPLFLEARFSGFGVQEVGYLFAYCGVLGVLFQGALLPRLVARFGERALIRAGFLANVAGFGLLASAHSLWTLVAASTVFSFGNSMLRPNLTSRLTAAVDEDEQGRVLGLTTSIRSASEIVMPPLGGAAIDQGWIRGWALALSVIFGASALLREPAPAPTPGRGASPGPQTGPG